MSLGRQMLAAVGNLEPTGDDPAGEFFDGAFAILTAALGKLPEERREAAFTLSAGYCVSPRGNTSRAARLLRGWQQAMAMRADADAARPLGTPAGPSAYAGNASAGPNGSPAEAKKRTSSLPEFPIRLGLNITPAMAASLGRMHRRLRLKEAVIGRLALMQYLATNDPGYREE